MGMKLFFLLFAFLFSSCVFSVDAQMESKPCAQKVMDMLQKRDKTGYEIATKVKNAGEFAQWLDCNEPPLYGVTTAVHETSHELDNELSGFSEAENEFGVYRFRYFLGGGKILTVTDKKLFYRAEIGDELDDEDKSYMYYETYLTGDSGNQDILLLLEELNAYTHGLNSAVQFEDMLPANMTVTERDGPAVFMYYLEMYLRKARKDYPEQWKKIYTDADYLNLMQAMWARAEKTLMAALKFPRLGMKDKAALKKVYAEKNIGEMTQTFEKGGVNFSYDADVLNMSEGLKQAVTPVKSKTKTPTKTKTQETDTGAADTKTKTSTSATTTQGTTIMFNGKKMTLKEFEDFLKDNPDIGNNPQVQEMLKQLKGEK